MTTIIFTTGDYEMTYGIKKAASTQSGKPFLFTTTGDWISARFVGLGSNHSAKEWKTEAGAKRAAVRRGGEVFVIAEGVMNY